MRSCEYTTVTGERKTKLLCINNFRFFLGNRELNTQRELHLHQPTSVTITFVRQKNGVKEADITMHYSKQALCPVRAWRSAVLRVLSYPTTTTSSQINLVLIHNKLCLITSKTTLCHIRSTVSILGRDSLGFEPDDVGNHSIRSSFAMFLYLNHTRSDKIMLQGRWLSQAFLDYIRPQVSAFSAGLSEIMLENGSFYTVPDKHIDNSEDHIIFNPEVTYLNNELFPNTNPVRAPRI